MTPKVLIIGGGVTGMQVARVLGSLGVPSILVEKGAELGGKVPRLSRTFPLFSDDEFRDGASFASELEQEIRSTGWTEIRLSTTLKRIEGELPRFHATLDDGFEAPVAAVVVAAGFEPYNPTELHEYGYGVYPDVITAFELEWLLNPKGPTGGELRRPSDGTQAKRLAIAFCVGSRNRRIGAPFCSRICCSYSTKQAIQVRDQDPNASVTCFYMDVRTYDRGFEEMYATAQERGVRYIRGRISTCRPLPDGSIAVRAENTLLGRPFWGEFDLVSLSTGMRPFRDVESLVMTLGIERAQDGFLMCKSWLRFPHDTTREGVFVAGCATGSKPIRNCMIDGAAAAARVASVLNRLDRQATTSQPGEGTS